MNDLISQFVLLWAVIDPIGTLPVYLAVTVSIRGPALRHKVAIQATLVASGVLLFFVIAGEFLLGAMGIPLSAFQVAGGAVLFLFALTMIFGESKPEGELHLIRKGVNGAVFPLAMPSIASPGAMMAAILLTDKNRFSLMDQAVTSLVMLTILAITLGLMLLATPIQKLIGESGANIISRVMGLILSAVAINAVLNGIADYFAIHVPP
ncbi:MAG: MarC family protein [Oceanospirillaceae bacterium]|nr:MarC family protein [Oceanospirillaceae bacterium]